jgi:hypothetical protein
MMAELRRFFTTIHAPDRASFLRLDQYDFDLVHGTARMRKPDPTMEALLTLDEVARLVEDGYRVTVEEEASKRARARTQRIDFPEWLREMEA